MTYEELNTYMTNAVLAKWPNILAETYDTNKVHIHKERMTKGAISLQLQADGIIHRFFNTCEVNDGRWARKCVALGSPSNRRVFAIGDKGEYIDFGYALIFDRPPIAELPPLLPVDEFTVALRDQLEEIKAMDACVYDIVKNQYGENAAETNAKMAAMTGRISIDTRKTTLHAAISHVLKWFRDNGIDPYNITDAQHVLIRLKWY